VVLKAVRSKSPKTRNATEDAALHKRCDVNLKNKHRAIAKWQIAAINAEHTQVEGHLSSWRSSEGFLGARADHPFSNHFRRSDFGESESALRAKPI